VCAIGCAEMPAEKWISGSWKKQHQRNDGGKGVAGGRVKAVTAKRMKGKETAAAKKSGVAV